MEFLKHILILFSFLIPLIFGSIPSTSQSAAQIRHNNFSRMIESENEESSGFERILADGEVRPVSLNPAYRKWKHEPALRNLKPASRIVGGKITQIYDVPYQISIGVTGFGQWCGATIYNKLWIITAAHCFYEGEEVKDISDYFLTAGEFDLSRKEDSEQKRSLVKLIIHPGYSPTPGLNDIALVQIDQPFEYSKHVQPLPIASSKEIYPRGNAVISGWGYTQVRKTGGAFDDEGFKPVLKSTTIHVYQRNECKKVYANNRALLKYVNDVGLLCAGELKGGKDACQGDSGGPLACVHANKKKYLCGIVSTGIGCGLPQKPGFFTIVSRFVGFIIKHAGKGDSPTLNY